MEKTEFDSRMTVALKASHDNWHAARPLFEAIDADVGDSFDPTLYGWVHFYLFKSAFMTDDWERAAELAKAPRMPAHLTVVNAAWIASVSAEVAARLGDIEGIVEYGRRCLEIRRGANDDGGVLMAARTICALLTMSGADALAGEFADTLLDLAKTAGDDDSACYAYRAIVRGLPDNPNPLRLDALAAARAWLEERTDNKCAAEALAFLTESELVTRRAGERDLAGQMWEAALKGNLAALETHLAAGLDANTPWTFGRNSLHAAALSGHIEVVRFLLANGARPNIRTFQGRSALHFAAENGDAVLVNELIAFGADPSQSDMFGCSPVDLAHSNGHSEIAAMLAVDSQR